MGGVYGIGNPLMDIVMKGSYADLERLGVRPGTMNLVDHDTQALVLGSGTDPVRLPGGSAANTLRGTAFLSGSANNPSVRMWYGGAVGADEMSRQFAEGLSAVGVRPLVATVDAPTGSSAILVTPDLERTMFTHLGACRLFGEDDIDTAVLAESDWLYTTGYMWDTESQERAVRRAIGLAAEHRTAVAFDIADPFVVERYHRRLVEYLPGRIDLIFGNEEELARLTGFTGEPEGLAQAARRFAPIVALKIGKRGCVVASEDGVRRIEGFAVDARDTTGAGDAYAGGFLYALLTGESIDKAAGLANRLAAAVVTVPGCRYDALDGGAILREGLG